MKLLFFQIFLVYHYKYHYLSFYLVAIKFLKELYNSFAPSNTDINHGAVADLSVEKDAIKIIDQKQANRDAFIKDLKEMATGDDSWIIMFAAQINSSVNKFDFHISDSLKDGSKHTVHDQQRYQQLLEAFDQMMKTEYKLTTSLQSQRFPLTEKNLGFKLRDEGTAANIFAVRPSTALINFNNSRMLIAFRMAMLLSDMLDNGKGIDNADVEDFASDSFGYLENTRNNT